jgi:hypothetical protein
MISQKYPSYKDFYEIRHVPDFNKDCNDSIKREIKKLVDKIQIDDSHITIKIKQTLHFINQLTTLNQDYTQDFEDKDYPINNSQEPKLSSLDNVMATFPPPFFEYKIYFTKESINKYVEFGKMSSGERQFLFSISTVLYHIKNLMSVPENDNDRVKYKNFNIVLDEIELCFHPEYQREFVNKLIGYLSRMTPTEGEKKQYHFNIILATHSPFILSDIPKCNVMFLKEGKQTNEMQEDTFGANIHSLLQNAFFLNGTIGEFAKDKINTMFKKLHSNNKDEITDELYDEILLVSEPFIRGQLLKLYNERNPKTLTEIDLLKDEIKKLKKIINDKN